MRAANDAPSDQTSADATGRQGALARLERSVLNVFAILTIILMFGIVAQVVFSQFDVNPVVSFEERVFMLGDAVTLNTLLDAQWHLLVLIALFPAGLVLLRGGHVRVDFLYAGLSPRAKTLVDLVGHLAFAAPFFYFVIPAAVDFAASAHRSGQGSSNGGLNDLFVVKAALPIGLGLLALAFLIDLALLARRLMRR